MELSVGEKIRLRRQQLDMTVRELAKKIGRSHATVSKWERGETGSIKDSDLVRISEVLDCNLLWLMDLDDAITLDGLLEELPSVRPVPILGEIACGDPILAEENHDGTANIPESSSADFALRCNGDSMINARIFPGDLVLIRQQSDVDNGDIAAVLIDGEATLNRVYKYTGRVELRPENPLYPIINVEGPALASFRILGKAVSFFSEVR